MTDTNLQLTDPCLNPTNRPMYEASNLMVDPICAAEIDHNLARMNTAQTDLEQV
jgi:hypothetical protein